MGNRSIMSRCRVGVWAPALLLLFAAGCASTVPLTVYQPRDTASVQSFFRNGAAIGAIYGDSVFALAQVESVDLVNYGEAYVRLWLLVENHSSMPMLVEPLKCASLNIESTGIAAAHRHASSGNPVTLTPASPTKILAMISNAKATSAILSGIGAALEAAAAQPTKAVTTHSNNYTSETTTLNDKGEKERGILDRRATQRASTSDWYDSFKSSVNQGILRRNTLFPGEGVNGYIYFRAISQPASSHRRYIVTLAMPEGEKIATFDPIEGV